MKPSLYSYSVSVWHDLCFQKHQIPFWWNARKENNTEPQTDKMRLKYSALNLLNAALSLSEQYSILKYRRTAHLWSFLIKILSAWKIVSFYTSKSTKQLCVRIVKTSINSAMRRRKRTCAQLRTNRRKKIYAPLSSVRFIRDNQKSCFNMRQNKFFFAMCNLIVMIL